MYESAPEGTPPTWDIHRRASATPGGSSCHPASQAAISCWSWLQNVPAVYVELGVASILALAMCTTLTASCDPAAARFL